MTTHGIRSVLWRWPWLWAWIVASAIGVPLLSFRHQSELMGCYLPAASRVASGMALPGPEWWVYPPVFTITVLPLVPLPVHVARMAWALILVTCAVVAVRLAWNTLMLDPQFRQSMKVPVRFFAFAGLWAVGAVGHAAIPLAYQAHDLWIVALIAAGAWYGGRAACEPARSVEWARSEVLAGVSFGMAASFKVMPVLFLPVLLVQRRWRAAVAMSLTGICAALAFDLGSYLLTGRHHFVAWLDLARAGSDLTQSGGGRWAPWNPLNQSGTGILSRLMIPTPTDRGLDFECMIIPVDEGGRRVVLGAWIASLLAVLFVVVYRSGMRGPRSGPANRGVWAIHALGVAGATSGVYLLVAPHSSNYHFAPVALALAASLGWMASRGRDLIIALAVAGMVALELIPGRDVVGGRLRDIILAYGPVGACALLGFIASCRVCVLAGREGRRVPAAQ